MSSHSALNSCIHAFSEGSGQTEMKRESHQQYFENLEHKLLEESEKLTNFMGKSFLHPYGNAKIKFTSSPSKDNLSQKQIMRKIKDKQKKQAANSQICSIKKVKQMQELLKRQRIISYKAIQKKEAPNCHFQRKFAYDMNKLSQEIRQCQNIPSILSIRPIQGQKLFHQNNKYKFSLKDTVSTDNSKSQESLKDHFYKTQTSKNILTINDFKILKYLEQGKFGEVFLVQHKQTNFVCALKKLRKQVYQFDEKVQNQLIRQIKIQSFLDHPNIVPLYSIFKDQEFLYLLIELCNSGNLLQHLKRGHFNQEKVRVIMKQVCHAVEYMHDNDIIHRDIKPQNILFHESIVKVCDFGWSVASPLLRETVCGTPIYSSPQLVQKKQYDSKVDIWNIGILTYELLYGKVPFEIRSEEDLTKVVNQQIYFPKSIPASLEIKDFINQCLIKDPKKRISITKLIDHQFLLLP